MYNDIIKGLSSSDPKMKERSADEVTDVANNLPESEVQVLAQVLAEQVLADSSASFREAALNALCELQDQIKADIDAGGYVDDPEFCMIRSRHDRTGSTDARLVYADALFVGGSMTAHD
ncbi:hypothetical protein G6O69_16630 [Pseudenhygromyxa sp. WMMC2535]|uniref:hypothetical protein n=1 Tax=Pseudenhygromyxa sp. WMMC2535 TaxID=2712867 RepID=UPI0015525361|nr:hypothetical protein [Pseudenhygromyxa sp. WMMC2535]NVB39470.1 hypothetical protein [Pseudenhygromyxa sp. WMMC2535]